MGEFAGEYSRAGGLETLQIQVLNHITVPILELILGHLGETQES